MKTGQLNGYDGHITVRPRRHSLACEVGKLTEAHASVKHNLDIIIIIITDVHNTIILWQGCSC